MKAGILTDEKHDDRTFENMSKEKSLLLILLLITKNQV
jgi:hypothetical protein